MRRLWLITLLLLGLAGGYVHAQQQVRSAPEQENPERPEYRTRSLPNDIFKPSEKVTEDFPVPFPEDI